MRDPVMEIYYHKKGAVVDFIIKEKLEIKQLVQVCYDVEDPYTKNRTQSPRK
jgi:predicted AAA+ superfamily ATPase